MIVTAKNNPWAYEVTEPHISIKVRNEIKERSNGVCERCYNQPATEVTPALRRWEITDSAVVHDYVHLCPTCRGYCENTHAGRIFMVQFRQIRLMGESK